jgi:hypothetical protein
MPENYHQFIGQQKDKAKVLKTFSQLATIYVQNAIENSTETTYDATQNLVNNIMKKRRK